MEFSFGLWALIFLVFLIIFILTICVLDVLLVSFIFLHSGKPIICITYIHTQTLYLIVVVFQSSTTVYN